MANLVCSLVFSFKWIYAFYLVLWLQRVGINNIADLYFFKSVAKRLNSCLESVDVRVLRMTAVDLSQQTADAVGDAAESFPLRHLLPVSIHSCI